MMTLQFDPSSLNRAFSDMANQIQFATSLALNRTAFIAKESLQNEMRSVFDRPTPWTLNSLFVTPSTKTNLQAKIWFQKPERMYTHYLEPQVYGGGRRFKGTEHLLQNTLVLPKGWYALPGPGARLDSYGNMSRGQIVQILSALQSLPAGIGNRPLQYGLTRGSRAPKVLAQYFVIQPNQGSHLQPGVWMRTSKRMGVSVGASVKILSAVQVLSFVQNVSYRKRFDFFGICKSVMEQEMAGQFEDAFQFAISTKR